MSQLILPVLAIVIGGMILWGLKANWKTKIRPWFSRTQRRIAAKLRRDHKETPEEAEERHRQEMLTSDDPDIWKPLP